MTSRVLVVGPSWVGDMVMADAAFQLLASRGLEVHVVAPAWSQPVLVRMPSVTASHALSAGHGELALSARRQLGHELRAHRFDQAVVLPRSFKAALVPWFARIPTRTGFRGEMRYGLLNDIRPFDKGVLNQTVKRFAALALTSAETLPTLPRPVLTTSDDAQARLRARFAIEPVKPLVCLMPGAEYGPAKCWPLPHFRALAGALTQAGKQVVILGSAGDRASGEQITTDNSAQNLCGETSLADAIDLTAMASVVVSNDSGLMHVAAAVGTHVVALYGSTTPDFTPPLTDHATIMQRDLDCRPCFERTCPLGHLDCLTGISPTEVARTVYALCESP